MCLVVNSQQKPNNACSEQFWQQSMSRQLICERNWFCVNDAPTLTPKYFQWSATGWNNHKFSIANSFIYINSASNSASISHLKGF